MKRVKGEGQYVKQLQTKSGKFEQSTQRRSQKPVEISKAPANPTLDFLRTASEADLAKRDAPDGADAATNPRFKITSPIGAAIGALAILSNVRMGEAGHAPPGHQGAGGDDESGMAGAASQSRPDVQMFASAGTITHATSAVSARPTSESGIQGTRHQSDNLSETERLRAPRPAGRGRNVFDAPPAEITHHTLFRPQGALAQAWAKAPRMDAATQLPIGLAGSSIEDIAKLDAVKSVTRELDESQRLGFVQKSFDDYHIDTAFPIGTSLHAMATAMQRISGVKYDSLEALDMLMAFNQIAEKDPNVWLSLAQIMEVENGWPEIENADPEEVEKERVSAVMDDLSIQFGGLPKKFYKGEVALSELKKITGLGDAELTEKLPVTPWRSGMPKVNSILNLFMENSKFKSYAVVYNIYPDKIMPEPNEGYGSPLAPVIRVHYGDGSKKEITPALIEERATFSIRRQLNFDPWMKAMARSMVRGYARKNGRLPPADTAKERAALIKKLTPTPRETSARKLRAKASAVPVVGRTVNIAMLARDLADGDYQTFVENLPIVSDLVTVQDVALSVYNGNHKRALQKTLGLLPYNIGNVYKWVADLE